MFGKLKAKLGAGGAAAAPRPKAGAKAKAAPKAKAKAKAAAAAAAAGPKPKAKAKTASPMAIKRLRREYKMVLKSPPEFIHVTPLMSNVFEWHYCIEAPPDTPYHGGFYWGYLRFPGDYPWKPPSIRMVTTNGRFKTNYRLCLSMSDYHPETWSPSWTVSAVLIGLLSFMLGKDHTLGAIKTSDAFKREAAAKSMKENLASAKFREIFPELVERFADLAATVAVKGPPAGASASGGASSAKPPTGAPPTGGPPTGGAPPTGAPPTGAPPTGAPPKGKAPTGAPPKGKAPPMGAPPKGKAPPGKGKQTAPPPTPPPGAVNPSALPPGRFARPGRGGGAVAPPPGRMI